MLGDTSRLRLRDSEGYNQMSKNGSFTYEELNTLYDGVKKAIYWTHDLKGIDYDDKEYLCKDLRDILVKIEKKREEYEDRKLKKEVKEFEKLGW